MLVSKDYVVIIESLIGFKGSIGFKGLFIGQPVVCYGRTFLQFTASCIRMEYDASE
jgi:hypothetical protein